MSTTESKFPMHTCKMESNLPEEDVPRDFLRVLNDEKRKKSEDRRMNMDKSQYICFCRKVFPNETAFKEHLPCVDLVNAVNKKTKYDIILTKPNEVCMLQPPVMPESENVIKIMKIDDIIPSSASNQVNENLVPSTSKHLGKRLPSRTKVPFLSRAVPLSTDHSFERCPCGAVFVTRVGKRQHQARFCKLTKNKNENKGISRNVQNVVETIQIVSPAQLGNAYIESEATVINEIFNEQTIIQYEVDENCIV